MLSGDRRQHRSVARGEPLRLLEEKAGLPVAEVTEILRQSGDYKKAVEWLSEGKAAEAFAGLDRLGWIKQVPDAERYQALAAAYLAAVAEKKRGEPATALVISPTHAEAARVTDAIRAALKAEGKLGEERTLLAWAPAHLTVAEKGDAAYYEPGRSARLPPERAGSPARLPPGSRRGTAAAAETRQAFRGLPPGRADPGGGRPRPRHRQRPRQVRQASAQ